MIPFKKRALMIRDSDYSQQTIPGFDWPLGSVLDEQNRWVKLSQVIPWEEMAEVYHQSLGSANEGRPAKDARLVIGAVIIKHKLGLSDRETVSQIQENPYLQYFVGLSGYQKDAPFSPTLLVEIRKRMGQSVFDAYHQQLIDRLELIQSTPSQREDKDDDDSGPDSPVYGRQGGDSPISACLDSESLDETSPEEKPSESQCMHSGKLILDATVADQQIAYPTDLNLLNRSRELTEQIIDLLYPHTLLNHKPRTYRQQARRSYLQIAKQRRPSGRSRRRGIKAQLQYVRRNLKSIDRLLDHFPYGRKLPLPNWLLHRLWVIRVVHEQQWEMYRSRSRRCDDRIVSLSQPYVRPIIRGKVNKPVEFGSKLSVSLTAKGLSHVDHMSYDNFNEGGDLPTQVERYRARYGYYPEVVLADPIYGTRENRGYLKGLGIRFGGKPLGRPKKETPENRDELKAQRMQRWLDYRGRNPIEGKFGQGKLGYGLSRIRSKRKDTSVSWVNSVFLVMNLLILLKVYEDYFCLQYTRAMRLVLEGVEQIKRWLWLMQTLNPSRLRLPCNNNPMFG